MKLNRETEDQQLQGATRVAAAMQADLESLSVSGFVDERVTRLDKGHDFRGTLGGGRDLTR
jgi:hypothetical protein